MEQKLIFVGYHNFKSQKGNDCFVLDFITEPRVTDNRAFVSNVSIFTTSEKYNDFIKSKSLLTLVSVKAEITGDKVRYSI